MATGSHKKFSLQIIIMPTEFKVPRVPRARRYEPPARRSYHGRGRQEYEVRALKPPPLLGVINQLPCVPCVSAVLRKKCCNFLYHPVPGGEA